VINEIIDATGATIDIEDDGTVFVTSVDGEGASKAIAWIEGIVREAKPGEQFLGTVTKLMAFGAFVEYLPGKEGLVHISEIDHKRIEKVEDVLKVGDKVSVVVKEIDSQGRVNLSMKALKERPGV
jgi:polyribonucleotide nucleotidyltransferase